MADEEEVEVPWWTYGGRGMQLWFPSALAEPLSPRAELACKSVDPELEFDKEVYPIGISLAEVAIIGAAAAGDLGVNHLRKRVLTYLIVFLLVMQGHCVCISKLFIQPLGGPLDRTLS